MKYCSVRPQIGIRDVSQISGYIRKYLTYIPDFISGYVAFKENIGLGDTEYDKKYPRGRIHKPRIKK